LEPEALAGKF